MTLHGLRRHLWFELFSSKLWDAAFNTSKLLDTMPPRLPPLSSVRFLRRTYATTSASSNAPHFRVFDRAAKEAHRTRAALSPHSRAVDYLRDTLASRLVERLLVLLPLCIFSIPLLKAQPSMPRTAPPPLRPNTFNPTLTIV